jgi:hypothetical protein
MLASQRIIEFQGFVKNVSDGANDLEVIRYENISYEQIPFSNRNPKSETI